MWPWLLVGVGVLVATLNVLTMRRLWRSAVFERSQKIAQTLLLWLVPGSVVAVRAVLGPQRASRPTGSTMAGGAGAVADWIGIAGNHQLNDATAGGDFGGGDFGGGDSGGGGGGGGDGGGGAGGFDG